MQACWLSLTYCCYGSGGEQLETTIPTHFPPTAFPEPDSLQNGQVQCAGGNCSLGPLPASPPPPSPVVLAALSPPPQPVSPAQPAQVRVFTQHPLLRPAHPPPPLAADCPSSNRAQSNAQSAIMKVHQHAQIASPSFVLETDDISATCGLATTCYPPPPPLSQSQSQAFPCSSVMCPRLCVPVSTPWCCFSGSGLFQPVAGSQSSGPLNA